MDIQGDTMSEGISMQFACGAWFWIILSGTIIIGILLNFIFELLKPTKEDKE